MTGTVTDAKGRFQINNVPTGEYVLKYSLLGYEKKKSSKFRMDSHQNGFDAGTIFLKESALNLGEVMVTGEKPLFGNSIDRKVYNVQQDIMSKTGSVSDLLQNVPSVQVDIDGTVSLRGSSNVLILINGKPSPLLANNSADALQQMPASSVEKIEVITNPSARFTPEGTSGIINIVMKKEANLGFNGNVSVNAGNSSRYNFSTNGNYNPGTVNVFGTYNFRQDERNNLTTVARVQLDSTNVPTYYNEDGLAFARPFSHFATLGLDYRLNDMENLGLSGNYRYRGYTSNDITTKNLSDNSSLIVSDYDRRRIDYDHTVVSGLTAFFQHNFEGEDHKVRFEFNGTKMFDQEDNRFTNVYRIPTNLLTFDNTLIRENDGRMQLTVDYHHRLTEHSTFEAGYEGRYDKDDFDFYGEYFDANQQAFINDLEKTNRFIYHEAIHALYSTYENSFGPLGVLAGLRAEQAFINSNLVTKDSVVPNDYFKMYPTLHLAYKLSEFNELQLNYSLRTNRPRGDDLNPFPEYRDPRNVRAGNPYLKPEFIHSIEFGCQFQNDNISILPSIFYRNRYNGFTSVTRALNDTTLLTTSENLSTDQSAGVELVVAGNVGSMITTNASANAFYEEIDASNLGFGSKKSTVTWSGTLNCNVNLSKTTMIQINSNYRSSRLTPQGENLPSFVMNLGARQHLFDEKLSLIFTVSDIFRTLKRKTELNTAWLTQDMVNSRDSRVVFFGLTYHFGSPPKKSKDKSLEYDDSNS